MRASAPDAQQVSFGYEDSLLDTLQTITQLEDASLKTHFGDRVPLVKPYGGGRL